MGGINPYHKNTPVPVAKRPFQVTLLGRAAPIAVEPSALPYGRDGRPGSLLDILLNGAHVEIDHACGGVTACSTCHIIVREGLKSCNSADEDEEDMLDTAPGLTPFSRLACQCVPDGSQDLVVEIPSWNRNAVKE